MSYDLQIDQGGRLLQKKFMCSRMPKVRQMPSQLWPKDRALIPQRPQRRYGQTICKMRLVDADVVSGGNQKLVVMNRLINALFWGGFLIALAACSAWCWCKEKIKGK